MGVTYFRLDPKEKYGEFGGKDFTANRSLTGAEIDSNFNFLRGFDIASIETSNGNLIVKRLNPEEAPIEVPLGGVSDIQLDEKSGILKVISPSGEEREIGRCVTDESGFQFATDDTIDGTGTFRDPLRISRGELTGTYAPADELRDLTTGDVKTLTVDIAKDEKLPAGYRIVTKEKSGSFGFLYNWDGVDEIKTKLADASSPWRVPTKADWDELLDYVELLDDPCTDNPNQHDTDELNVALGTVAGKYLKSANLWDESSEDVRGLGIKNLLRVLPVGTMRNIGEEVVNDFGKRAAFWCDTVVHNSNEMYVKRFDYNKATVLQEGYGPDYKISLRLVKDATTQPEQEKYEDITALGVSSEVVPIGDKVWLATNLGAEILNEDNRLRPDVWDSTGIVEEGKDIFIINEWDGTRWVKRRMYDGTSIILRHYKDPDMPEDFTGESLYHEYRVLLNPDTGSEEFKDIVGILQSDIQDEVDTIKDLAIRANARVDEAVILVEQAVADVAQEKTDRESEDARLDGRIDTLDSKVDSEVSSLTETITDNQNAINNRVDTEVAALNGRIDDEVSTLNNTITAKETQINNRITEEVETLNGRVDEEVSTLNNTIDSEVSALTDSMEAKEETLNNRIDSVVDEFDANLSSAITTEKNARIQADDALQAQITANKIASSGNTIIVTSGVSGTNVDVNFDNNTIKSASGQLHTNLKLQRVPVNAADSGVTKYTYALRADDGDSETINIPRDVTIVGVTPADSTYAQSYQLQYVGNDGLPIGAPLGAVINIPKDQFIRDVKVTDSNATVTDTGIIEDGVPAGAETVLAISFVTDTGGYRLAKIDVSEFIEDSGYGDGLYVDNHIVKVKIATNDDGFLGVSSAGLYTTGITDAISNEAQTRADADSALNNAITTEAQTRANADNTLSSAITAEAQERESAVATLGTQISTETQARSNADTQLSQQIAAETTAREAAISDLADQIASDSSDKDATIAELQSQVSALTTRIATLESQISSLTNTLETTIKNVVGNLLDAQEHQLELDKHTDMSGNIDHITIKFASDAEFIAGI